jgi:type III secretion protein L
VGLAFLITGEHLQLLCERKVLKEAEYAAVLSASEVVETARREAQAMADKARLDAKAQREAGYREGLKQARQEAAQRLLVLAVSHERQLQGLRTTMAQVVVRTRAQLLAEADPRQLYKSALLRVQAVLGSEPFVSVRVCPAREAALRAVLAELGEQASWAARASVTPDASLADGACVLQTASGTIDLSVEAQIDAFRSVIEQQAGAATRDARRAAAA